MLSRARWTLVAVALGVVVATATLAPLGRETPVARFPPPQLDEPRGTIGNTSSGRDDALRRAHVWRPAGPAELAIDRNPPDPGGLLSEPIVRCRFLPGAARGTTPKFDCVLSNGEVVKVKYGHTGEVPAEVAASRLLTALGFGADRMYVAPRVRCYGCPRVPFYLTWALDRLHARDRVAAWLPDDRYTDFEWAAVERRFDGTSIRGGPEDGWAWFELDRIEPSVGSSRAEVDALRLAAVLLAHWDNKAANQRLVCLDEPGDGAAECRSPFAIVHDLGATFGPNKMDLAHWRASPIWSNPARCTVSMRDMPYDGGTFVDAEISEAGRALLVREIEGFDSRRLAALFTAARFPEFFNGRGEAGDVDAWVRAFRDKIRQIEAAGPCPPFVPVGT